jgi:fatty acid desaturase
MNEHLHWRRKARLALEAYFERRSRPRVILTVVLIAAGLVGLLASIGLFHAGVERMWLRYPLATLFGYGAFLGLLRAWIGWEHRSFAPAEIAGVLPPADLLDRPSIPRRIAREAWEVAKESDPSDVGDILSGLDAGDEGCFVLLLIAALLGVVITLLCGIFAAPALLAEVFLDAFLITVIYQRLRVKADEHWLGTAIRRTWKSVLCLAVLLSIIGSVLSHLVHGARSLGEVIQYYVEED